MKKKFQLIVFAMVALLTASLFIGCIGEAPAEEKEGAESIEGLPIDWKTYVNKELGFKFKYPANWEVGEIDTPIMPKGIFYFGIRTDIPFTSGFINVDEYPVCSCEEGYKHYFSLHSYKVEEWKNITLGGEPAIKVVYPTSETQKVIEICTLHKNKKYVIHFVSDNLDKLDELVSQINQIVKSFEFI
jgi:hypothetical protein